MLAADRLTALSACVTSIALPVYTRFGEGLNTSVHLRRGTNCQMNWPLGVRVRLHPIDTGLAVLLPISAAWVSRRIVEVLAYPRQMARTTEDFPTIGRQTPRPRRLASPNLLHSGRLRQRVSVECATALRRRRAHAEDQFGAEPTA